MSSFLKDSSVYLVSNILNAAIPFLLLPILTRYLTPDEYGQVAMFQVLTSGLTAFIGLNSVGAAARHYFEPDNVRRVIDYNVACIYILFLSLSFILVIAILFESKLSSLLSIPNVWVYLAIFFSFASFIVNFRLSQWQIRKKAKQYGGLQVGQSFVNVFLSLVFVVFFGLKAQGRIDAQLVTVAIFSIFSMLLLFRDKLVSLKRPNLKYIKSAVSFGFPLVPHIFGAFLLTSVDRVIIKEQLGLDSAGVYLLAVQFSMVLSIVFDAINKAYVPWLFENLSKNDGLIRLKIVRDTYKYFICLIIVAIIGFYLSPPIVRFVVGSEFEKASIIIGWLLLGQIFGGMYLMVTNYIFYSKETKLLSLVTVLTGILNVGLLCFLIPEYGLIGAGYAFCVSMFIRFLFVWVLASKKIKMPWLLGKKYEVI